MEGLDTNKLISTVCKLIRLNLIAQVPVVSGKLKSSIKVSGRVTPSGITFSSTYLGYGVFLDTGTGPYATKKREAWNKKPGKGKGGIKPRFWTTLTETTRKSIRQITVDAIKKWSTTTILKK